MFCRFGSVRRQPAGGGHGLVERGVDAAVVGDRLLQPLHRHQQLGHVPVPQQVLQQRVPGLREQPLQRVGVRGVPGLDLLGLGQPELVEQDPLQLLGRAEVELPPHHRVRRLGGGLHLAGEVGLEVGQVVGIDGDADVLEVGQHAHQRQLDVAQQRGLPLRLELGVQHVREGHHRSGTHAQHLDGRGLLRAVEGELAGALVVGPQLALEEAQRQVGEVERALAGAAPGRPTARCRWSPPAGRSRGRAAPAAAPWRRAAPSGRAGRRTRLRTPGRRPRTARPARTRPRCRRRRPPRRPTPLPFLSPTSRGRRPRSAGRWPRASPASRPAPRARAPEP